ncbi:MAG TPA: glycine cleavage system protein GcvH [Candidatus Limnocylindria bacterium]|nr:glycine cleavage system protein GcvH [Candidatus Limnocylindria bacterium]
MPAYPDDLRYSREHEWVRAEGETATVGITTFAADELGDIVYLDLPEVGSRVEHGATFGVVESVKAVSDLYAPVSGEVLEVNDALRDSPELVNGEAFGAGWIVKLRMDDAGQLDELLDAKQYAELTA